MIKVIKNIQDTKDSDKIVKKSIKKIQKLSTEMDIEVSFEESEVEERMLSVFDYYTYDEYGRPAQAVTKNVFFNVYDLTITFSDDFKFEGGWELVALVGHIEGFFIPIKNDCDIPEEFNPENNHCDHCDTKRYRRKSFLIKNENDEYKQVGSGCVKKFLGVNAEKYFRILNDYLQFPIVDFGEEGEGNGGGSYTWSPLLRAVPFNEIVDLTKNQIGFDNEYVKNMWDEEEVGFGRVITFRTNEGNSTSDKVKSLYSTLEEYRKEGFEYTWDLDVKFVKGFVKFINNLDGDDNEYITTIKEMFSNTKYIKFKDITMLSSAVSFYLKDLERKKLPKSNHLGQVGEKEPLIVTVQNISTFATQFGMSRIYRMVDDKGNIIVKFGKINGRYSVDGKVEKGSTLKFNGQVKKHDEFNGVNQTVIGRLSKHKV